MLSVIVKFEGTRPSDANNLLPTPVFFQVNFTFFFNNCPGERFETFSWNENLGDTRVRTRESPAAECSTTELFITRQSTLFLLLYTSMVRKCSSLMLLWSFSTWWESTLFSATSWFFSNRCWHFWSIPLVQNLQDPGSQHVLLTVHTNSLNVSSLLEVHNLFLLLYHTKTRNADWDASDRCFQQRLVWSRNLACQR